MPKPSVANNNQKRRTESQAEALRVPERREIDDRFKWDISIIFASTKLWEQERTRVTRDLPKLARFQGKLATMGPAALAKVLAEVYRIRRRIEYLSAYASRCHDTDIRRSDNQAMTTAAERIYTEFRAVTAFIEPELIALSDAKLRTLARDPRLSDFDRYLTKLVRLKAHVLSLPEEVILAGASAMAYTPYHVYKTFSNAEMVFPSFVDADGRAVVLSPAMYSKYRQSPNRNERKVVFERFWGTFKTYRNTFARMLAGQVKYYDFAARTRRYKDALHAALVPNGIPPQFYNSLLRSVRDHLGAFQRYLKLRKRLLGIEGPQRYYDIYPMAVAKTKRRYSLDRARQLVTRSVRPLGRAYQNQVREALTDGSGWLDVFPNAGKRSGAYSSDVYGKHPLVLLNFTEDFESLSTLAHELGHAMHSALSNDAQPYPKASYALFNAEVASIFNETLLIEYLLGREKNDQERMFLLSAYLDSFRGTVFRQTMFAEFELAAYKRQAAGKALTADSMSRMYLRLLRQYHGHKEGVMTIDPLYGIEWAYIPHFYYNFYVYQYVSGFIAATALARRVLTEGRPAARRYIEQLLEAGRTQDPIDILRDAGVDMMSPEPYAEAMGLFQARVKELDTLTRPAG